MRLQFPLKKFCWFLLLCVVYNLILIGRFMMTVVTTPTKWVKVYLISFLVPT